MTIASAQNTPRTRIVASGGQTAFTVPFEFFAISDLKVYVDGSLATYNANPTTTSTYKVTSTNSSSDSAYEFGTGGTVTFGAGLTASQVVVIVRDITIERLADFAVNGTFDVTALNTELDKNIAIFADQEDQINRSIRLDNTSASATLTIPTDRNNKIIAFDGSGNVTTSTVPLAGGVTTTTLSAGASATGSYNSTTGVLTLGIPQGATGATGPAGSGTFNSFTITDGSTSQTIEDGNTLTLTAGTNMQVSVSATDTVTITNTAPDPVALAIALG
mgnify:CR=1 FL=1|tara:strand:- start:423 stop:1247 length:825 start_codon:yes stop_codon:yes gene_type:complete